MEQVLHNESEFAAYHVEALIGRGGMSEVYRATNPRLDNKIALKLLAPELSEDESFRERFIRESRLAASLDHPNVVPIYDAGEWEGTPYIAMRFVDGPDLKQLLETRGALPADYAVGIVAQVAAALDAAHHRGLIHRDVKPGNILIDEKAGDGTMPHVYLADFGVAKHRQSHSGLTSKGHYVGTIDYVAPEQIEGRELSAATDVYALGCVLYETLTGEPPFDRDSNVAMIFAHLSDPPPALTAKRTDLPAALDAVIAKALAKKAEERYQTCRELVTAAREALASETAFAPAAQATLASGPPETVLAGASAPVPPETMLAAAVQSIAPPPVPPTQLAGATPAPPAAAQQATDEPYTLRDRPRWRSRRRLAIAFVVLLLAAGSAVAGTTLIGGGSSGNNSGQNKENSSNNSSGQSGSALNPGDDSGNRRNRDKSSSKSSTKSSSKSSSKSKSTTTSSSSSSTRRTRTSTTSSSSSSSSSTRRARSSGSSGSSSSSSSSSSRRSRSSGSSGSSSSGSTSSSGTRRR